MRSRRTPRVDLPVFDDDSPLLPPYWQALGRLVCSAANAEYMLRTAYYSVRPELEGPASAEGATCDRLIDLCLRACDQRSDFVEEHKAGFIAALESLRSVNKQRNRLFHDSWLFMQNGTAVHSWSAKSTLPAARVTTVKDVEETLTAMTEGTNSLMASMIRMTGGGTTTISLSESGEPWVVRQPNGERKPSR